MNIKAKTKERSGFTLIELIVVMAILSILASIGVPRMAGFRESAERTVCETNRKQFETHYNSYISLRGLTHSPAIFDQIKSEIYDGNGTDLCPLKGQITYFEGHVTCGIHADLNTPEEEDDEDAGEVPYL